MRMLAVLFSGTRMTNKGTTPTIDVNAKHGLGKTTNLHYTTILGPNLHKENIGKESERSGKNVLVFIQQVKDLLIKSEQ